MRSFPAEILDAARMDGAGSWRVLWQIVVPNMGAPLASARPRPHRLSDRSQLRPGDLDMDHRLEADRLLDPAVFRSQWRHQSFLHPGGTHRWRSNWQIIRDIPLPLLSPTILLLSMMTILFGAQWSFAFINVPQRLPSCVMNICSPICTTEFSGVRDNGGCRDHQPADPGNLSVPAAPHHRILREVGNPLTCRPTIA
ncbi:hypothetical protein [Rhizobium sp. BK376]|uniref:hypothetical protein n=1 Tax=Rhizobium sp. BK376 TaxID=2512149 RepID=UPI001FDEFEC7|nr:hypothetical protein [Rhizobium sp. BK376]